MKSFGRRWFLRGAAGATLALPLLPSFVDRAFGQGEAPPKRLVFFYVQNQDSEGLMPSGTGRSFTLDGTYLHPLAAHRDRITVVRNLEATGHNHDGGHSELLSGWPAGYSSVDEMSHWKPLGGPTLDQYIASRIETPLGALGLTISDMGLGTEDHETSWRRLAGPGEDPGGVLASAAGEVIAVPHIRNPLEAFRLVFGDGSGEPPVVDRSQLLRRSLLDSVIGDYNRLKTTLPSADAQILDAHAQQLRDLEMRLGSATPITCGAASAPSRDDLPRDQAAPIQLDTIAGALRCGATNVATFTFGASGDEHEYPWLDLPNFHQISHANPDYSPDPYRDHFRVREWQAQQLAYFVDRLAATPEGDGTLLDHTTIVWMSELGYCPFTDSENSHLRDTAPVVIIGDANRWLDSGQVLDASGSSYQDFLFTLVQAMGFDDVTRFGSEGTRIVPGLQRT